MFHKHLQGETCFLGIFSGDSCYGMAAIHISLKSFSSEGPDQLHLGFCGFDAFGLSKRLFYCGEYKRVSLITFRSRLQAICLGQLGPFGAEALPCARLDAGGRLGGGDSVGPPGDANLEADQSECTETVPGPKKKCLGSS